MNTEKKKIIFISVRSDFGGGPYHIDLLISNLKNVYDIFVAAPLNKPYGIKWKEMLGEEKFFELPFRSFKIGSFLRLRSFTKDNNIDFVHSHGKGAGIYSRLLKLLLPKTFIIHTFHGIHILNYGLVLRSVYISIEKFLSKFTTLFINVSNGEKKICLSYKIFKEHKSIVVYNAIDKVERSDTNKNELRDKLNLPANKFIIISVVRFNQQKNLKATISIAEKLKENQDMFFLIIGDGEEKPEIKSLIKIKELNNILLEGYKENINEYLSSSDLYLSTSLWEGLPYSLIEATAAGLAIVASKVTGNNEVVKDGQNGFLFNLSDLDEAAQKILKIKNSEIEYKSLSDSSLKIFNEKFHLDAMINKMKDIYNNL